MCFSSLIGISEKFLNFLERGLISVVRMVPKHFETILMKHFGNTFIIFLKVRCGIFENINIYTTISCLQNIIMLATKKNKIISIYTISGKFILRKGCNYKICD